MNLALRRPRAIGKLLIVAAVAALAFAVGSALVAQGAPEGATHYACVSRTTGTMRYVNDAGQCTRYEQAVSWSSYSGAELDDAYVNEDQPDSITTGMIVDGQVMNADLAADSVTGDKILDGAISADDLGTDSVGSDEIINGSITSDDLGTNSVGSDEIQASAVGSSEVLDNSLTADDLAGNSVGTSEIQIGAVTSAGIADETIIQGDLSAGLQSWIDGQTLEGYDINEATFIVPAGDSYETSVSCDPGKSVVGGGVGGDSWGMHTIDNHPFGSTRWYGGMQNSNIFDATMTIYVICVGS